MALVLRPRIAVDHRDVGDDNGAMIGPIPYKHIGHVRVVDRMSLFGVPDPLALRIDDTEYSDYGHACQFVGGPMEMAADLAVPFEVAARSCRTESVGP